MDNLTFASKEASFNVPPPLDVKRVGDHEIVHIGSTPIAHYSVSDVTSRRHVMVQLGEAGRIKGLDIARCFGVTPIYVSQLRGRYREQGSAALKAARRGPKGPMKVTARLEARVRKLRAREMSYEEIAQSVSGEKEISYQTVRRIVLKGEVRDSCLPGVESAEQTVGIAPEVIAAAEQQAWWEEADTAEEAIVSSPEMQAVASSQDFPQGESRYAGAMLLHVALGQLGLWSVFESLGAQVGRSRLAVKQVVGIIALGFALRLRSIEGFKTALKRDFGMLLGLPTVPVVQTLRTQVRALAESVEPQLVMRKLLEAFVELEPVWEGAYYVDGHFCPYSGSRPLSKGWNAKRRVAEPGQTDVYVHDATGRALFFINRPLNDHLSRVLPKILEEIRSVAKDQKILLIFDRGGYSGTLFRELDNQGIGFITYLKGRKAKRRFSSGHFERRWWEVTDPAGIQKARRYVYNIYEKGTRVRGAGVLRTLVVEDEDGQIPVLTNSTDLASAKVVHLLKMRWRQENSFKYLSEHYGVEQLIQYGATYSEEERLVENPARAKLRKKIEELQAEIVFKEAELGQALEFNDEKVRRTARGVKLAHSALRREINGLYERVQRLQHRLAQTPSKVALSELTGKKLRATMNTDRRNLVNAIKIATYNAERLLARCFFRHYADPRDWLTMFRAILHLPGRIACVDGTIRIDLRTPDGPRVRQALAATLEAINQLNGRAFGNGEKLVFTLRD
jgi:Homeodomain-like domain/Transposase DDE domain